MDSKKPASGPKKVHESMDLYASLPYFPYLDSRDLFAEAGPYGFMDGVPQQYLTRRDNRMAGELLPLYINWWQLKIIRDRSRQIARNNEFAIAAINAHRNYVVGTGFTYSVQARSDDSNQELIKKTQDLVDLFVEHNRMAELESEVIYRLHSDGECFLRSFKGEDGLLRIRFIEPELVRPPADDTTPASSFGIKCADEDIHHVVGYWVVEKPWQSLTPTLVPAEQILHLKLNSESNSKRGLPTIYAIESNLRAAEDVLQSMIAVAKARSKIAVIRKVNDSPPEAIQALTQTAADYTVTDPVQNRATTINHMGYGSILTSTGNVEYDFPAMNIGAADLVETLSANLRAIAARFGITETMMSTDASNNNYASALVAEAPAVKTFERMQRMVGQAIGERRTRPERALIWQQLGHAVDIGMLPRDVLDQVVIRAKGPQLVARDYDKEAQTARSYMDMGLWSPQTITAESGKNFEEEQRNISKAQEEKANADFEIRSKYQMPGNQSQDASGPAPEDGASTDMQDTALNGAQVTSLVDLAIQASGGTLPITTAKAIATAAFPKVSGSLIDQIFSEIEPKQNAAATDEKIDQEMFESMTPDEKDFFDKLLAKMPKRSSMAQKEKAAKKRKIEKLKVSLADFQKILADTKKLQATRFGANDQQLAGIVGRTKTNIDQLEKEIKTLTTQEMKEEEDAIAQKIKKLMDEGYPQDQAVAIALSMKRRGEL